MNRSQLAVGNPAGIAYNYPLANMITNTAIATMATAGSFIAAGAITGDTQITLQSAIAGIACVWGSVWWISNVLRRIDKRFSKFELRQENQWRIQERQWRIMVIMIKKVFPEKEVEALLLECNIAEEDEREETTKT